MEIIYVPTRNTVSIRAETTKIKPVEPVSSFWLSSVASLVLFTFSSSDEGCWGELSLFRPAFSPIPKEISSAILRNGPVL